MTPARPALKREHAARHWLDRSELNQCAWRIAHTELHRCREPHASGHGRKEKSILRIQYRLMQKRTIDLHQRISIAKTIAAM